MVEVKIIPVDNSDEEKKFIKKMYCMECKERGYCTPKHQYPVIEDGYHFDIITCKCNYCSETFDLKFFNVNSYTNQERRKLIDTDDSEDSEIESYSKKSYYPDFMGCV